MAPWQVSPELFEPLVTVVATLGVLAATPGDVPVAGPARSLRAGLVALVATVKRAMSHPRGEATNLRGALATTGDAGATAATIARKWREAVTAVAAAWAAAEGAAVALRDACGAVAAAVATGGVTVGHLVTAVAQEGRARQELLVATRQLPLAAELASGTSEVATHRTRVAEASAGLRAATEATEKTAVAVVETAEAKERGQRAAVAQGPLGRLVAACHEATGFYCHLQHLLEDIEATVATGRGGPEAPEVAGEGPGVPRDLMAAVAAAEKLWDTSALLAKGHLLETLRMVRGLLVTLGTPDATAATTVAQRCRDATAALPGLLARGHQ
ncbi:antifreeze protein Maxi-like [Phaenicophaeus curvirostris]|uniref:antifreeze protein Maxi-like n=1 Tax=Phaenicophaeus curvirostris TaxID=33595 RepID=UPI0037F0E842